MQKRKEPERVGRTLEKLAAELFDSGLTLPEAQREFRKLILRAALDRTDGNKCHAAKELDIHRNTVTRIEKEKAS